MTVDLTILLVGFSILSSMVLLCAYLFYLPDMRKSFPGKIFLLALVTGLVLLQFSHYFHFIDDFSALTQWWYLAALVVVPVAFYFFSRAAIFPEVQSGPLDAIHVIPLLVALVIPTKGIPALAFTIGACYSVWFAVVIFRLRFDHQRFKMEIFFFSTFALMALLSMAMGVLLPYLDQRLFYLVYANCISLAILLIVAALIFFPELLRDFTELTEIAYARTKLADVDTELKLRELHNLMAHEKVYLNEDLSLTQVADLLSLSSHQLSELINTAHEVSFPKYVREFRVQDAMNMLKAEPNASVLSIGMATGFRSQSAFYTAFKESTGYSPGDYRKN